MVTRLPKAGQIATVVIASAICCSVVSAECVVVGAPKKLTYAPSTASPMFHVAVEGKPVRVFLMIVPLEVSRAQYQLFSTDEGGNALVSELAPGKYSAEAFDADGQSDSMLFEVKQDARVKGSPLRLSLRPTSYAVRASDVGEVSSAEGAIVDIAGAVIPGARIAVLAQDRQVPMMQFTTNGQGRFAARLEEGRYMAFVTYPGFVSRMIRFKVSAASKADLTVRLKMGLQC